MSGRYLNLRIYGRVEIQCDNCFMFWVQLVEGKDERTTVNCRTGQRFTNDIIMRHDRPQGRITADRGHEGAQSISSDN